MAVKTLYLNAVGTITQFLYVADTEAERPAGNSEGDFSYTKDTNKWWSWTGAAWEGLSANTLVSTFSKGGIVVSSGITVAINVIVWRAPFAGTVTAVKGYRVGGTGATINARRNGASNHLASALSLTSADTWIDGGAVQNTAYAVGDKLEIMIVSATGSPTQIAIQVDFTKP